MRTHKMEFSLTTEQQTLIVAAQKFAIVELPEVARQIEISNCSALKKLLKKYAGFGVL